MKLHFSKSDEETNLDGLKVSKSLANSHVWVNYCYKTTQINTPVKLVLSLVYICTGESFSVLGMRSGGCWVSREEMVPPWFNMGA